MSERLSKQLADLSARAKSAKEAIDAAETEASEKLAVRKEEARAAAAAAAEKVGAEIKSARDTADQDWSVVRAKVDADIAALKVRASAVKHDVEVSHLESRAANSEWAASIAIDYAAAAIEQAKFAVLDAIEAQLDAEDAKRARA